MPPDILFQYANSFAMLGWIALALSPFAPVWADRIAGVAIPLILSVLYTALILVHWSRTSGGYDTLDNVLLLFTNPNIALAGWTHYLAFDMLAGAWAVRSARRDGVPFALVLPCLLTIFLFGPAGVLAFVILQTAYQMHTRASQAQAKGMSA